MKKVIVSVINDLVTDQRVHRTCQTLHEMGFEVKLIGRRKKNSLKLESRDYQAQRMKLIFEKGPLFYMEFNIRLYFILLFKNFDLLVSNDLDTLLANFIIHKSKRIPLVFDSHEYFTESPEIANRKDVKRVWKSIEKFALSRMNEMITVNQSIARLFEIEYKIRVHVVRNIPIRSQYSVNSTKEELGLPLDKKLLIIQGAGLNIDRGLEELVEAMALIKDAILLIVGDGDVLPLLKERSQILELEKKIIFIPKQTPEKLRQYTHHADLGVSFDKCTNLNYELSLPNKIFDYLHAGLPIIASPLVEIKQIIDKYKVGECIENHEPQHIANKISSMLTDEKKLEKYKLNTIIATEELNWENERNVLINIFNKYA
jgi:glycosyltransferase involved in cell wall biosynthesis